MEKISKKGMYTIVLEDIRSKFELFGEGLQMLNEKMERGFNEMRLRFERVDTELLNIRAEIIDIKQIDRFHEKKIQNHEVRITALED